jgi:hypothetical protein
MFACQQAQETALVDIKAETSAINELFDYFNAAFLEMDVGANGYGRIRFGQGRQVVVNQTPEFDNRCNLKNQGN